jgi:hypothetical protein
MPLHIPPTCRFHRLRNLHRLPRIHGRASTLAAASVLVGNEAALCAGTESATNSN